MTDLWKKILKLDRRWIFLVVALVVAAPILFPLGLPVFITQETLGVFETIDTLPEGSPILVGFDYEPASTPECDPMALALLRHCARRNLRVIGVSILPLGVGTGENILSLAAEETGMVRGEDYTFLGFKAEQFPSIIGMGISLQNTFPTDRYGNDTSTLPVLEGVSKLSDFAYMVDIHDDNTIEYWVLYGHALYGLPMGSMCTAIMATGNYPFLDAGQINGIVGGLKGGSEYEKLLGLRGAASKGMDSQAVIHLFLAGLMILGNIAFLRSRKTGTGAVNR
jgi:hypothetical protein